MRRWQHLNKTDQQNKLWFQKNKQLKTQK